MTDRTTTEASVKTTKLATTATQFFHKTGDINAKLDHGSPSNIHSRRVDDKTWLYPQQERASDKQELQTEVEQHLERNVYGRKRVNEHDPLPRNNEYDHNSNNINPSVPFGWQDIHIISEQNYPRYHSIPKTRFTCRKRAPGYYADPETGCQVFHMCQGTGVKHSFLCPNTTIFNQRLLVCDWYSKVTCGSSESFYSVNNNLYQHQPERENVHKPQANRAWNNPQNQHIATTKYSQPDKESYIQNNNPTTHADAFRDTEVTDVPQFIVNHFKENIPHAEVGRPKSVTKSYSAVISTPRAEIHPKRNSARDNHRSNDDPNPLFHQKLSNTNEKLIPETFPQKLSNPNEKLIPDNFPQKLSNTNERLIPDKFPQKLSNTNEKLIPDTFPQKLSNANVKLIPDTFLEKQRAIKNSWNAQEMEKTLNHELLKLPELNKAYHEAHLPYSNPAQEKTNNDDNNYHTYEKTTPAIPSVNNGNSYYVPNFEDNRYAKDEEDEIHFAGRQNGKVIVVNRNRLQPGYESSENPDFPESGKTTMGESLSKFTHPVPTTVATQTPYNSNFQDEKKLNHEILPQSQPYFQSQGAYEINNGGNNNQAANHNMYNHNAARNQKQGHNEPRIPQYIYPLPGIVHNNDGKREFNYGYRVEDPKTITLQKPEIFQINTPRFNKNIESDRTNKNILIKPDVVIPRFNKNSLIKTDNEKPTFNKNILIKPNHAIPRFNKNILIKPDNVTPRFNKNIHSNPDDVTPRFNKNIHSKPDDVTPRFNTNFLPKPDDVTPRFNKNFHSKPDDVTPRFNKNIHLKPDELTPGFNKNINSEPDDVAPRFNKNIHLKPDELTPGFHKNIHLKPDSETQRFNKNIHIETDRANSGFNKNILIKPDTMLKSDSQEGKIKYRIAEIKSGIESIGAQVGKILKGDENAFKNVRVFKLNPESPGGELEEIRLMPFKFERQSRVPQHSKVKEEKRESLSLELLKNDPNVLGITKIEFKPNMQVRPINGGKKYEGNSNFKVNTARNAGTNNYPTQTPLPVQKLVEQVVRDIAPKHKEVSKLPPAKANYGTGTLRSNEPMIKVVPHSVRTVSRSTKREMNPVGTHETVKVNQYKQLPRRSGRADYGTEIRIADLRFKEKPEKRYEVKYIPLIKVDHATKPKTDDKKLLVKQEIIKVGPLFKNEKSEHFDHVVVPKKIQGRDTSDFIYPRKIKVQENGDMSPETKSTDSSDWEQINSGVNGNKYKYDTISDSEFRNDEDLTGNFPHTKSSHNDQESLETTNPSTEKRDVRTFVVLTKPVPVKEKFSNIQSNKAYQYENHKTRLTPIQTKSQFLNQDSNPSLECDDSSSSNQNSFNTLTLQLGKNGPSQEFMKYIPSSKPASNERGKQNVKIYYNSGDESSSKCRNQGDSSKSKNQDISVSESVEEKQKTFTKKPIFTKKPVTKVTFKELKRPKHVFTPDKTSARFNTKTTEDTEQKIVLPKLKPIKLFELQRNSRPAITKPSFQRPIIPTIPESKSYFEKTGLEKTLEESEEDSDKKSTERSKRVAGGNIARYADLERAAELKIGIQNPENEKKAEIVNFPAARNGPQSKTIEKSDDSDESSNSHSRQSRYADMEKAVEQKAELMIRSKSRST